MELLTTMAIIGTLLALILPAIGSAREAARRMQCASNLKQIGVALHNYHDAYRGLPPGWQWDPTHQTAYGWAVAILPMLDQTPVYQSINRGEPIEYLPNSLARSTSLPIFLCPSDIAVAKFMLIRNHTTDGLIELPTANYIGVFGTTEPDDVYPTPPGEGAFIDSRSVRFAEFTDGLSNTFIVGERTMGQLPSTWYGFALAGEDHSCRVVGHAHVGPNCTRCDECEFASRHSGTSQFLWGDGHVAGVSHSIDSKIYQNMSTRSNGQF